MTTQAEQTTTNGGSQGPFHLYSAVCSLLPPQAARREFKRHVIRSQIELLRGVQSIVEGYVSRLEAFESEETDRPKRTSKIKVEDEEEKK